MILEAIDEAAVSSPSTSVLAQLIRKLLHGQLDGEKIAERSLEKEFGGSRTPVREALQLCEGFGFFERRRGSLQVKTPTLNELEEIMELRTLVEPPFAERLASRGKVESAEATRHLQRLNDQLGIGETEDPSSSEVKGRFVFADIQFHLCFAKLVGVSVVDQILGQLLTKTSLVFSRTLDDKGEIMGRIRKEHQAIIDAISSQNPEEAKRAVLNHLEETKDRLGLTA